MNSGNSVEANQIPMTDIMCVAEVKCADDLSEELARFFWRQTTFLHEIIKEFAATDVFQHEITAMNDHIERNLQFSSNAQVFLVLVHIVQVQYVRMLDKFHDGDLTLHLQAYRGFVALVTFVRRPLFMCACANLWRPVHAPITERLVSK